MNAGKTPDADQIIEVLSPIRDCKIRVPMKRPLGDRYAEKIHQQANQNKKKRESYRRGITSRSASDSVREDVIELWSLSHLRLVKRQ